MRKIITTALFLAVTTAALTGQAAEIQSAPQSKIDNTATKQQVYPKIVLYSTSWCPHCKAAKEYFTHNNIPFINRDVEVDPKAMEELTGKYKSQGVPVIVIGDDKKVLKGFTPELFEKSIKDVKAKSN